MYTNMYIYRQHRGRCREIVHHERHNKLIGFAEQRHRVVKLYAAGMHLSQIAHQLGVKRKTVRNLIAIRQCSSLPKGLDQAFKNAKPKATAGPLFVAFDRSKWQPSEGSVAAAGDCTTCVAA